MALGDATRQLLLGGVHLLVPTIAMFVACIASASPLERDIDMRSLATSIAGGTMYTCTGLLNLVLLRSDTRLAPRMAYSNSIMAWSAFFFGPAIAFTQQAPLSFFLHYGRWYCIPNFGWGVEWGLQLLGTEGSGLRCAVIMSLSIASYFLVFAFGDRETGFLIALMPQVVAAIAMCVYCFCRVPSRGAAKALFMWVAACICFLIFQNWYGDMAAAVGPTVATLAIKTCDCTQIHFSTRFFTCLFRTKHHAAESAHVHPASAPLAVGAMCTTAQLMGADTSHPGVRADNVVVPFDNANGAEEQGAPPMKPIAARAVASSEGPWWC